MLLTDLSIKALRAPERGAKTYFDDTVKGFGVRVSQGGTKAFILVHGKARTRIPIGRVGVLTLKQARDKARSLLAEKQLGRYQAPTVTFSEALDLYISQHIEKSLKPKTAYETKRLLEKHFRPKLQHERIDQIQRAAIASITGKLLGTPSLALHAHTAITGFFRWATAQYLEHNPLIGLKPPYKQSSRERVLTTEELGAIFHAAQDPQNGNYGKLVALLILTGQRVNQIASLDADFIDYEGKKITWPARLMKGNKLHMIPYGEMASAILEKLPKEGLLFPAKGRPEKPMSGFSKLKIAFDKECGVANYRLHDIRRTFASGLQALGIRIEVTEKLLAHASGTMAGIVSVYQRHSYMEEMGEAIAAWEAHLATIPKP